MPPINSQFKTKRASQGLRLRPQTAANTWLPLSHWFRAASCRRWPSRRVSPPPFMPRATRYYSTSRRGGGSVLSTEATACQVAHATRGHQRHPPVTSAELPLSTKERLKRQEEGSMVGSVSPGVEGARGQRSTLNGPVEATCITHAKLVSRVLPPSVPGSYAGSTRWLARTQGLASGPLQLSVLGTHAGSRPRLTSAGPGTYLAPI